MLMTRAEFKERFKRIQVELPEIFRTVRNENIVELAQVMTSGDHDKISEIQRRMNAEAQRRIAAPSEREGVPIEFGEIEFNAAVDFNIEVNIEGYFLDATPPDQMPA